MNFENLAKVLDLVYPGNLNGNPSGLAIRVLNQFRTQCLQKYEKLEGLPTEELIVCQLINQLQDKRLQEIDTAIRILEEYEQGVICQYTCFHD